jgi:hypothetical protein
VYDNIAPILEKKGVPAVFFINPAFIDNQLLFYRCKISLLIHELKKPASKTHIVRLATETLGLKTETLLEITKALKNLHQNNAGILDQIAEKIGYSFDEYLRLQKPFLTTDQVRELAGRGFDIGAHSLDHPYYKLLDTDQQFRQTTSSCSQVTDMLGSKECSFSFPHSDKELSQELFDLLLKTNIPAFYGIQNQKEEWNNRMLHRFNAERPQTTLQEQVKGLAVLSGLRVMRGTNNVIRN